METKESIENILNDMLKSKADDAIDIAANRIELLFQTMIRQERLKADYLRSRYEKGLDNYIPVLKKKEE
jgi:hypothetical protein